MRTIISCTRCLLALVLALMVSGVLLAPASFAGDQAVRDAELHIKGDLQTGQPVTALFDLKGYALPGGSYSSINVRFLDKPDGAAPKVRTGYPETTLVFDVPGTYRIIFILNEVSKPSCGGVNAKTLLEKTVELSIGE